MVPAARGLSVPRSVVWIATTITLGIAAVAAIGCGSAAEPPPAGPTEEEITACIEEAVSAALEKERAAAIVVETAVEDEPEPLVDEVPSGPTEAEIAARIDAAVARALLDAEVEAERQRRTQEEAAPMWIEVSLNPTPPDAYCEDSPHYLALESQVFADSDVHKLRIALKPRSDGVIWVAVEDDAGWPYACHVYSAEDWIYNPDTGWYHSGPIIVLARRP